MPLGEVLYESGDQLQHVYFPTGSIVSLLYVMAGGASAENALVGNEAIVGIALFMGGETMLNRAVVQSAGYAYQPGGAVAEGGIQSRRGAAAFVAVLHPGLADTDVADGVCERQQLCRWLLLSDCLA